MNVVPRRIVKGAGYLEKRMRTMTTAMITVFGAAALVFEHRTVFVHRWVNVKGYQGAVCMHCCMRTGTCILERPKQTWSIV
jgi:hypothetical protein